MHEENLIPVVRLHDPAFGGVPFEAVKRYASTRDPADLPSLPAGVEPITFWFRRLTRDQVFGFVQRVTYDEQRYLRAFCAGVCRITGGRFGDGWEPAGWKDTQRVTMTEAELDEAQLSPADIEDIGQVIYLRSCSPFDCAPRYPLRLSCLAVWEGNARRYAERNPDGAAQNSDKPRGG